MRHRRLFLDGYWKVLPHIINQEWNTTMKKSKTAYVNLVIIAALIFGKGLHLMITPPFWNTGEYAVKADAILQILIGIVIFFSARRLRPKPETTFQESMKKEGEK
jgi:hypothetical protein